MTVAAIWLFWLLVLAAAYAYVGFPLLVALVGWIRNREVHKRPMTPKISLIIAAYNEEQVIAARLENALTLNYPADALEIIVASDGSSDATESIVAGYSSRGVRLLALARSGKVHALNEAVRHATGEILVFSDANILYHKDALRVLMENFADPEVGGVAGNTVYRIKPESEASSRGEGLYWSYDKWIKQMETRTGSTVSAHGAIYAIRRELYRPINDAAVTDDFAISTGVIEQGYRLIFERGAVAYEAAIPSAKAEFSRKVRIISTGLRALFLRKALFNPFRFGFYSVILFSHKVLRRLIPVGLLPLFVLSWLLSSAGPLYLAAAVVQTLFYGMAALGYLLRAHSLGRLKCFYLPFFYCMANAAALVALARLAERQRIEVWQPQRHGTGL
jgi:cellulose synthase/poly-beta-1,6-N-acetylglucosamine synthase-like glycosyltransferase